MIVVQADGNQRGDIRGRLRSRDSRTGEQCGQSETFHGVEEEKYSLDGFGSCIIIRSS